ncbi:MAG TPA: hypothetical protein VGJ73_22995 [Verrucomicrobiae bacterium]|jgi:hypothetical protein
MPIDLQVIRASDFVRIDAEEHLNFEESKKALEALVLACQKRGLDRAVLDVRDLPVPDKPQFTNTELAALVGAFRTAGFSRHQRLAVLYRQDIHGGIRKFTFFSRMRGLQVQAFQEFESAMHWLWKDTERLEQKHGTRVTILQHDGKKRATDLAGRIHSPAMAGPVRRFKRNDRIKGPH